jgi:hypothetical protein
LRRLQSVELMFIKAAADPQRMGLPQPSPPGQPQQSWFMCHAIVGMSNHTAF